MSSQPTEACTIETLCRDLTAEFERDAKGPKVAALLAAYAARHDCWLPYENFCAGEYTRHLIHKDEHYEMILLCWDAHQQSPIHNHMDENCWMAVVDGIVEEVQYTPTPEGPLLEGKTTSLERGGVAYIHDDIALHLVRSGGGKRGASLHIYAKPYATCLVYDPATGAKSSKDLVYHAVRGEVLETPVPSTVA
jgi:cysteine dioxygenase